MRIMRHAVTALLLRLTPARWRESIAGDFEEGGGGALSTLLDGARLVGRLWIEEIVIARTRTRRISVMHAFASHLRRAARALAARPAYSLIVIATLAIGIGANASVFTLANWLLFRPFPAVHEPERLVTMRFGVVSTGFSGNLTISHPEMTALAAHVPALESVAGSMEASFNLAVGAAPPERVQGAIVSANYFDVLGIRPGSGRAFSPTDPGVVISHAYWRTRLGGTHGVLGTMAMINGQPRPILGVAPPGFSGMSRSSVVDVWVPSNMKTGLFPGRRAPGDALSDIRAGLYIEMFGRLRQGQSIDDVRTRLDGVKAALAAAHPAPEKYKRLVIQTDTGIADPPYQRSRLANVFGLLMTMVGLLLVLTCANVGNVVLANGISRRAEIATRQALGASRGQIVTAVIVECVLLSIAGGALAVAIAAAIGALMRGTIILPYLAALGDVSLDWRVMAFAFGLSTAAAVGAGLLPALTATRFDLLSALKGAGRSVTGGGRRLRKTLLVAQVALSLTLLIGGLLLVRSVRARQDIHPGFDPGPLMSFSIEPGLHSRDAARLTALYSDVLARVSSISGVERAAFGWSRPFGFMANDGAVAADGSREDPIPVEIFTVGEDYFETMGIRIIEGRGFAPHDPGEDYASAHGSVIVSEAVARRLFGSAAAAVGRSLVPDYPEGTRREIVGVAADARLRKAFMPPLDSIYYRLEAHAPWATVHVRLAEGVPAASVAPHLRDAVRQADSTLPVYDLMTVRDAIARQMSEEILIGRLTMAFALIATFLAAVGLYGVLAQSVTERRVEIGIRAALGAAPARVLRMVTSDALRMTAFGAAAGLALAVWLGRYIESRLFGVERFDAPTFAAALAIVVLTSLVAAAIPAARAARVDPVTALRQ